MGHYDLILVSSHSAQRLFDQLNTETGFPLSCIQNCHAQQKSTSIEPLEDGLDRSLRSPIPAFTGLRVKVPVKLLLLATNEKTFSPEKGENEPQASMCTGNTGVNTVLSDRNDDHFDFILTASFHGSKRSIMGDDLGSLPGVGAVVGANWDQVRDRNMFMNASSTVNHADSWLSINRGQMKYECKSHQRDCFSGWSEDDWTPSGSLQSQPWSCSPAQYIRSTTQYNYHTNNNLSIFFDIQACHNFTARVQL